MESVISELSKEHRRDFHVVRLNGFLHTDDKLALKETWRQLGKEMAVEDDLLSRVSVSNNPVTGSGLTGGLVQLCRHHGKPPGLAIPSV